MEDDLTDMIVDSRECMYERNQTADESDLTTVYLKGYADAEEKYKKKNKELSNQILKLYKEQDNYNARIEKKNAELKKKDRQINLMAKYLAINGVERDICNEKRIKENCKNVTVDNITVHRCKKCIKQYFERKSENGN